MAAGAARQAAAQPLAPIGDPPAAGPVGAALDADESDTDELADAALGADQPANQPGGASATAVPSPLELFTKGGWLMAPIVLMSLLAAAVGVERVFGLRRSRVTPRPLERGLRQLAEVGHFEPRTAYRLCQEYPSALGRVVTSMVSLAGRSHAEVTGAANEAIQREADKQFANVRTLNLTSAVTPLMGLLGTVGGMIIAFYQTQALPAGQNKSDALAEGIYLALVTTFAGLVVAIPAAVAAHYLEGRIQRIARRIEATVGLLLPRLERLEGSPRVDLSQTGGLDNAAQQTAAPPAWPHPGPPLAAQTVLPAPDTHEPPKPPHEARTPAARRAPA